MGEALFFAALFLLGLGALVMGVVQRSFSIPESGTGFVGWGFWLVILVGISFLLIGGGGLIYIVLHLGTSVERRAALARHANIDLISEATPSPREYPFVPNDKNLTNSPGVTLAYRLPTTAAPGWRLLWITVFTLLWNVIVAVMLIPALGSYLQDDPDWQFIAFVVPFLLVGIWAIYYFLQQFLYHAGIGPIHMEISDHPLHPGLTYEIFLSHAGRLDVRSLEFNLICQEEATYRQGTDVRRELCRVYEQPVFHRVDLHIEPGEPFEHRCELEIPKEAMHSFQAHHNAIHWKLEIRGEAEGWPGYTRDFPVVVFPNAGRHEGSR